MVIIVQLLLFDTESAKSHSNLSCNRSNITVQFHGDS